MERTLHNSVNQNEVCVGHFAKKAARLYSVDGVFGALRRDKSWHCENDYAANASKPTALTGNPLHWEPKVKETRIPKVLLGWVNKQLNQK